MKNFLHGVAYRYARIKYADDPISGKGAIKKSGRYGLGKEKDSPIQPNQKIKITYLSITEETARWEIENQGGNISEYILFEVEYNLFRVLDLTDPSILDRSGLSSIDLRNDWRSLNGSGIVAPTQKIGIQAYEGEKLSALKVPSLAPGNHSNLVIFPDRLTSVSGEYIETSDANGKIWRIPNSNN
jgi:RES domain-containing protein